MTSPSKTKAALSLLPMLSIVTLFMVATAAAPRAHASPSLRQVAYTLGESFVLLVRQKASLDDDAGPLDATKRRALRSSLTSISTSGFDSIAQQDVRRCRDALLRHLDDREPVFDAELLMLVAAVFVDAEIHERDLDREVSAPLAQSLGGMLGIAQVGTFLRWQLEMPVRKQVSPEAGMFVEYLAINSMLTMASDRPVHAQAALLTMNPQSLRTSAARTAFEKVHVELLAESRKVSSPRTLDTSSSAMTIRQAARLGPLSTRFGITDADIRKYGGETALEIVKGMRKLADH